MGCKTIFFFTFSSSTVSKISKFFRRRIQWKHKKNHPCVQIFIRIVILFLIDSANIARELPSFEIDWFLQKCFSIIFFLSNECAWDRAQYSITMHLDLDCLLSYNYILKCLIVIVICGYFIVCSPTTTDEYLKHTITMCTTNATQLRGHSFYFEHMSENIFQCDTRWRYGGTRDTTFICECITYVHICEIGKYWLWRPTAVIECVNNTKWRQNET